MRAVAPVHHSTFVRCFDVELAGLSRQARDKRNRTTQSHHVSQFLSGHVCGIFSCRLPAYTPAMCSTPWTVGPLEPTKNASLFEFSYVCPEPVLLKKFHGAKDALFAPGGLWMYAAT